LIGIGNRTIGQDHWRNACSARHPRSASIRDGAGRVARAGSAVSREEGQDGVSGDGVPDVAEPQPAAADGATATAKAADGRAARWWAWLNRGRALIALATAAAVGLFAGGAATGWWAADRYSPRSAPDITVVVAGPGSNAVEGVTMPDVRGLTAVEARQVLADVGLDAVTVTERQQPWVGAVGRVVGQEPVAGQPAPSTVTLVISAPAVIPAVVGTDVTEAVRALQVLGAEVVVRRVYRDGVPADQVLEVAPAAGQPVPARVTVTASATAATIDLTELRPMETDCSRDTDLTVNGVARATGLICRGGAEFATAVYLLGRKTARLTATLGQPDTVAPGQRVLLQIVADGKVVASATLGYGESKDVSISTAGVLRLELRARLDPAPAGCCTRGTAVFAEVKLVGGGAELLALRELVP
jgi:PASTA domain/NPCBM/NEW2 domain